MTIADTLPPVAIALRGALGTVAAGVAQASLEAIDEPTTFTAFTVK